MSVMKRGDRAFLIAEPHELERVGVTHAVSHLITGLEVILTSNVNRSSALKKGIDNEFKNRWAVDINILNTNRRLTVYCDTLKKKYK